MIRTRGLNHLALPVKDPERSARFYAELFDMEITSSSPEAVFLNTVGAGDMLVLHRCDVEVPSGRDTMHFGFMVDPEPFDEAVRRARADLRVPAIHQLLVCRQVDREPHRLRFIPPSPSLAVSSQWERVRPTNAGSL